MSEDIFATFERDVLAYNPFEGDFGEPGDRPLTDKMVTAAKAHPECHCCGCPIEKGERHRYKAEISDGELMDWRWCWACCVAMCEVWNPWPESETARRPDAAISARYQIRWDREQAA